MKKQKPQASRTRPGGTPGDWMESARTGAPAPAALQVDVDIPDVEAIYEGLEHPKSDPYMEACKAIESGDAKVEDAVLFCGRFNRDGMMLRESEDMGKPYKLIRVSGDPAYRDAMSRLKESFTRLRKRLSEAKRRTKAREDGGFGGQLYSNSDLGSNMSMDPNQFTEFTPWFSGPYYKNLPYAYFPGMAAAREAANHNPVAKRIIDLLCQYALGRGFEIRCNDEKISQMWRAYQKKNRIRHKLRKHWAREYLVDGEVFVDKIRMVTVDPSTIMDIVCEGYGEYIDQVLYYQQMYQTATQVWSGIKVPGVAGSEDSKFGRWIIRQIPYDQIIHIKTNVTSQEKRGRSVLYPILGWLKKLKDLYTAQVLGEQLRASFVWDDEVKGDQSDVNAHGSKYAYIPVAPSIFVHNESVTRKPLAPMAGVTGSGASNIGQELLAFCATAIGIPKDHLNVIGSSGSRATAIVGSEPFTKVIEDLQEDLTDLLDQVIENFCERVGEEYDEDQWQVVFPSVTKDTVSEYVSNVSTAEAQGYISKRRAATMVAQELECDNYDYDIEQKEMADDQKEQERMNPPIVPAGRFGLPPKPAPADGGGNPIHGSGKQDIQDQHRDL